MPEDYSTDDENNDPGPDEDDDVENDCWSFHQCYDMRQTGYCILKAGHGGAHFCGKCATDFY